LEAGHPARACVLEIAKAGSRAVALTRKILSFSRSEASKREVVDLQPALSESLSLLRASLPARIEIRQNFAPNLPSICADPSQLNQTIVNLATNAADAIGDGPGLIEVEAVPTRLNGSGATFSSQLLPGPYVRISIKDSGPGMNKATLGRVFEPFFTTKPQGRGTGMGLAVAHGIMKDHLGEVTAYSEPGKGAVFNLYFPAQETAAAPALPQAAPLRGHGQRILYVDDEEPLVLLISRAMKRLGYEVDGFEHPLEALKAFRECPSRYAALVTDLSMPVMSGTDLAREVKEIRRDIPVVLTSGYIRPQDQAIAREIGVLDLILKPDTVDELGDTLNRLLAQTPLAAQAAAGGA
jgi:CheY-like chemotaxis protein